MRSSIALVVLLLCPLACAHGSTVQKLEFDTYRIACTDAPLDGCLHEAANNACDKRAYFVVRGISDVNSRGTSESPEIALSSQAIVRCGPRRGWGDQAATLMSAAPLSAAVPSATPVAQQPPAPAAAPPAPVCAPGSTQACIGPAACSGGQACKADGSGYDPCDCGSPSPPPTTRN